MNECQKVHRNDEGSFGVVEVLVDGKDKVSKWVCKLQDQKNQIGNEKQRNDFASPFDDARQIQYVNRKKNG